MTRYDVVIAGAGPAGSSCALALARAGLTALLLERSHFSDWRIGETLAPQVTPLLGRLGLWDQFQATEPIASQSILSAWGSATLEAQHRIFDPYGVGWHLDRSRFDAMLAHAAAAAGAELLCDQAVTDLSRKGDHWLLQVVGTGRPRLVEASVVVDATGRPARIASFCGATRIVQDHLVSISGQFHAPAATPALLLEAEELGWWYSAPLPQEKLLVTCLTDGAVLAASQATPRDWWWNSLKRTRHLAAQVQGLDRPNQVLSCNASSQRLDRLTGDGWVAVGDAACAYDPLSGTGIYKAIRDGLQAGEAIRAYLLGKRGALDQLASSMVNAFEQYLTDRALFYAAERRWPNAVFWKERQASGVALPLAVK
jgi:flavin-dependent dehydrogenase